MFPKTLSKHQISRQKFMKTQASKIAQQRQRSTDRPDEALMTRSISFEKRQIAEKIQNRSPSPSQSGGNETKLMDAPS